MRLCDDDACDLSRVSSASQWLMETGTSDPTAQTGEGQENEWTNDSFKFLAITYDERQVLLT